MLVLQDLHWLPVRQRIEFKTALFVYQFVHGLAPPYLAEFCQASSDQPDPSPLRSADLYQLHVPRTKKNLGNQSFSVNGAVVWHSLPVDLRTPVMSLDTFKLQLKTLLFKYIDSAFQNSFVRHSLDTISPLYPNLESY